MNKKDLIPKQALVKLNNVDYDINCNKAPKLFILAGIEGNCDALKQLGKLLYLFNVQVYGLEFSADVPIDDINSIAKYYIQVIKEELESFNENEFYLGAYSFGGSIAVEILNILNTNREDNIQIKKLFLFDTSQDFVRLNSHTSFIVFKIDIVIDDVLANHDIVCIMLSTFLLGLFRAGKQKTELYECLKPARNLDEAFERAFVYLKENGIYNCENNDEMDEIKRHITLLMNKIAAGLKYQLEVDSKFDIDVVLFKPKKAMYCKSMFNEDYLKMKHAVKFDFDNYNLDKICHAFKIHEFENGNHWTFINENMADICDVIEKEIFAK